MHARMDASEAARLEQKLGAKSPSVEDANRGSQEENGAADHLSERSDASFATAEPNRPQAPAGKLKKTAFKLFGGKRSICTLPSFFGGKNKGQGKAASKKGLSKSKTHDGISDVGYEDSGHLRGSLDGGFPSPQLPTSQSTLLGAEANRRVGFIRPSTSLSGSSEGFEKKSGGEKSLFLPRSKKGLRGFFNSIRRHRKNKTAEPEKTELQEWTTRDVVEESQAKAEDQRGVGPQQGTEKGDPKSAPLPSEWSSDASPGISADLSESREKDQPAAGERVSVGDTTRVSTSCQGTQDAELDAENVLCTNATFCDLSDALEAEYLDNSPPSVPSGDQLSFMFGDVTSLKSFDSLTGCGDIIAEPDIDSIAGSSASAERSRDAAKRSSCLVTYQGGGEEMAMPDEIEEYLQQVWEGAVKAGETYETDLPELMEERELQGANGAKQETRLCVEGVDLLTPHSDQQESAPNSDEGYYDSTTPGPEEEGGEGLEEVKKDRLPRDSYSGDALYEFYETDDALLSPSHGDESWFDRKVSPPDIVGHFFDFGPPDEKDLVRMMGRQGEVMETEEERMAAIQKQLLYWELQREPALKHLEMIRKDQHPREKQHAKHKTEEGGLLGKSCEEISQHAMTEGLKAEMAMESRDCKDFQEMLYPGKRYSPTRFMQFVGNGSALDAEAECAMLESHALSGLALEKPVAYPFYQEHSRRGSPPNEQPSRAEADPRETLKPESPCELEQAAVNFSQALVEFTSSGTLFSSLSESLGSSDSGSAFAQNFPALPTMVTFDIVDVEQDGEGECEQHPEMNTNEELAASFEAFDESYVPKESFAECDERMFAGYPQGSFQGGNWGIASLPRRLRLQELCPPPPEPLSLCRRSRSLDTESLEFELASLQLSKNGFKPCELWSQWSGCKKDPLSPGLVAGQASAPCSPEGKGGDTGALSWPGLQNVPTGEEFSSRDVKLWDRDFNDQSFQSVWGGLEGSDLVENSVKVSGKPHVDGDPDRGFRAPRPMARPSDLPLQTPVAPQAGCTFHRLDVGDGAAKKLAWVLPLGERPAGGPPSFDFAPSPEKPAAYRPGAGDAKNVLASQQAEMLRPL